MLYDVFEEDSFAGLIWSIDENSCGMAKGDHDCAVQLEGAIPEVLGFRGWFEEWISFE